MALYKGWGLTEATCYCAFLDDKLVATSVLAFHFPDSDRGLRLVYDTDLFVDPSCADTRVLMKLLYFRNEHLKQNRIAEYPNLGFFAIAHQPQLFRAITTRFDRKRVGPSWAIDLGKSALVEIDLSAPMVADCLPVNINDVSIAEAPKLRRQRLPFGRWQAAHTLSVIESSEGAWTFSDPNGILNGYLCDFRKVRKLRLTKKGARFFPEAVPDQEVKYLIGSIEFAEEKFDRAQTNQIVGALATLIGHARSHQYDVVTFRDLPESIILALKDHGARMVRSERDIFAWGFPAGEPCRDALLQLNVGEKHFEALFL